MKGPCRVVTWRGRFFGVNFIMSLHIAVYFASRGLSAIADFLEYVLCLKMQFPLINMP